MTTERPGDAVCAEALLGAYRRALQEGHARAAHALLTGLIALGENDDCSYAAGDLIAEGLLIAFVYFSAGNPTLPPASRDAKDDSDAKRALSELVRMALRPHSSYTQRECLGQALQASATWQQVKGSSTDMERQRSDALAKLAVPPAPEGQQPSPQGLAIYPLYWSVVAGTAGDTARQAQELWATVVALGEQGRRMESLWVCELIEKQYFRNAHPIAVGVACNALLHIASAFAEQGDSRMEMSIYDDLLARFAPCDPGVARALYQKGLRHAEQGDSEQAMAAYSRLIESFRYVAAPTCSRYVAMALVNRGAVFMQARRPDLATADYDTVLRLFSDEQDRELRKQCAFALANKSLSLGFASRFDEAIAAIDQLVRAFSQLGDAQVNEAIASALETRAILSEKAGKPPSTSGTS